MRIFMLRHGRSAANGEKNQYLYDQIGDQNVPLTDKGWRQAVNAGRALNRYLKAHPPKGPLPIHIWPSTHKRVLQTAAGAIEGAQEALKDAIILPPTPLLIELTHGLRHEARKQPALKPFDDFYESVRTRDPFYASSPMGDSAATAMAFTALLVQELKEMKARGVEDILLCTHGQRIRNIMMFLLQIHPIHYGALKVPENASFYVFEEKGNGRWSLTQFYNGKADQDVSIVWSDILPCYDNSLPDVPPQFKVSPPGP